MNIRMVEHTTNNIIINITKIKNVVDPLLGHAS
jgi:hypothetical protein